MSVAEFLTELAQRGITLWAEGDQLHYRATKESLTSELRQELRERKAAILAFLRQDSQPPSSPPPLLPTKRGEALPLSFAQERLWFLEQLEPESLAYIQADVIRLLGALHVAAFEQGLNELGRRHEILRTNFVNIQGTPRQVVAAAQPLPLPVIDLTLLSAGRCQSELHRLLGEASHLPFDLQHGPLIRRVLLRLASDEHILATALHHIISDRASGRVALCELAALYDAYSHNLPSPLPELPLQYADFAAWQRQWMQKEVLEKHLCYWRKQLAGAPPVLTLPTDHSRPALASYRGAEYPFELPARLKQGLTALSQREGVTLFMTLLAAFQTLLLRYTGQDDLVLGTPITGRIRVELESLIGLFINTLVLRTNLSGNPSFRQLLQRVRDVCLNAYEHQNLPFEKLVEDLQPQRSLSYSPLFQVLFAVEHASPKSVEFPGLVLQPIDWASRTAKFDLSLTLLETPTNMLGWIEYSTDLFDVETIARLSSHYQTLLESIVTQPDQRLWELNLLPPTEQQRLLTSWAGPAQSAVPSQCLPDLLAARAAEQPDVIAIACEDQQLTYAQLFAHASQLARHLHTLGVGPEARVGLCLERSLGMLVSVLGVLLAGGAYVPLDPHYPAERLAFISADAQLSVLLTQAPLLNRLPDVSCPLLCLDRDAALFAQQPGSLPPQRVQPTNLAYVLYTSGSTGRPKGVQISHAALVNFLTSLQQQPGLTQHDIWLAITSLAFDIAGLELFLPLLVGARLELASYATTQDGLLLTQALARSGATVLQATPATWRLLLAAGWQAQPGLRCLCGGEALPHELASALLLSGAEVWNLYGPTETTIWSSLQPVREPLEESPFVGLGRPIAHTQFYVLDGHGHLAPLGVPGELCIGGAGLARGYLGRPDLTAERFIPDLFSTTPGARLYRTGDQVRACADGTLEYVGRLDFQVKLRGYRIELGEIESILAAQPGVAQAVVVLREAPGGDARLIAYVVPAPDEPRPTSAQLRQAVQERLPEHMVPSAFVLRSSLPLTPNGKLDRRALPAPEWQEQQTGYYEPPSTPAEVQLAALWAQVLGVEQVGRHDNFFLLGGHSLLATQLLAQVLETFQVSLPLRTLFEAPTIAAFAPRLEEARQSQALSTQQVALPLMRGARYNGLTRKPR